jgi:hypothetical protein
MTENISSSKNNNYKRRSFRVLIPKILKPVSERLKEEELISVPGFIRDQIIMRAARESGKRAVRARKLDIPPDQLPLPDPVWRKYQYSSINLEDFDIKSCQKDDNLFEFGREFTEQVNAAEIGPDDGIPINEKITLPRSFLLDSIHLAASQHCLYMQKKLGKPIGRPECPSPTERAKPFNDINEYYRTSIKTMAGKMKRNWIKFRNKMPQNETESISNDEMSEEETEEVCDDNETKDSTENNAELLPTDPDFDKILTHLLDIPYSLDPVPSAYEYPDVNDFGASSLWSFDTSSLLAFGILAEEFIERMIDIHLAKEAESISADKTIENFLDNDDESLFE